MCRKVFGIWGSKTHKQCGGIRVND